PVGGKETQEPVTLEGDAHVASKGEVFWSRHKMPTPYQRSISICDFYSRRTCPGAPDETLGPATPLPVYPVG
ncbi:MAG: hypothetical protein KJN92_14310, partial [Gemmatimonadetes bacterium]|nr:hypothetical protein [Gemmatimonadota bacterium]